MCNLKSFYGLVTYLNGILLPASHCLYNFSYAATIFTRTRRPDHPKPKSCAYSHANKKISVLFFLIQECHIAFEMPLAPLHPMPMMFLQSGVLWIKYLGRNIAYIPQRIVFGSLEQVFLRSFRELSLVL